MLWQEQAKSIAAEEHAGGFFAGEFASPSMPGVGDLS
jgi:hypothetical protein